jgi:BirA family biotin operon repressor/biotin-[acetyl-CoA-carboxylase] ligase
MSAGPAGNLLDPAALAAGLEPRRVGREIRVLPEVDSTNRFVLEALAPARGPSSDGCVVFAEYQTAGRGSLGRAWRSPRGAGLTFTVLLWEPAGLAPMGFTLPSAVAVAEGIEDATDVQPGIRWPNDLYAGGRKLGGILIEARATAEDQFAVAVGIGLNCLQHAGHFPPEIRQTATSLELASAHPIDRVAVARAILRRLDDHFSRPPRVPPGAWVEGWRRRSEDIGEHIAVACDGRRFAGRIVEIGPQAGLVLQLDSGGRRCFDLATITRG